MMKLTLRGERAALPLLRGGRSAAPLLRGGAVALLAPLAACSWLGGDDGVFRDRRGDYQKAEVAPELRLPAHLHDEALQDIYVIPPSAGGIDAAPPGEFRVPKPAPLVAREAEELVRIQRLGKEQWMLLGEAPGQLWPQVRAFLSAAGLPIAKVDARAGVLETGWLPVGGEAAAEADEGGGEGANAENGDAAADGDEDGAGDESGASAEDADSADDGEIAANGGELVGDADGDGEVASVENAAAGDGGVAAGEDGAAIAAGGDDAGIAGGGEIAEDGGIAGNDGSADGDEPGEPLDIAAVADAAFAAAAETAAELPREERYLFRIEQGVQRSTAELHVRQMFRTGPDEGEFPPSSADHEREAAMLQAIAQYIADNTEEASVSMMAEQEISDSGKVSVREREDGTPYIRLELPFYRAWASVELSLRDSSFEVKDLNRSTGEFYIRYVGEGEESWLGWLFGGDDDVRAIKEHDYKLSMTRDGEDEVDIGIAREDETGMPKEQAQSLLELIKGNIN